MISFQLLTADRKNPIEELSKARPHYAFLAEESGAAVIQKEHQNHIFKGKSEVAARALVLA